MLYVFLAVSRLVCIHEFDSSYGSIYLMPVMFYDGLNTYAGRRRIHNIMENGREAMALARPRPHGQGLVTINSQGRLMQLVGVEQIILSTVFPYVGVVGVGALNCQHLLYACTSTGPAAPRKGEACHRRVLA